MTTPIETVRGEALQEVAPDRASLTVTAHASGAAAEQVRSVLATASQTVSVVAATHRAAIESLSTSALSVAPLYDQRKATRINGYRGAFSTTVVVHDFDALSMLLLAFSALPGADLQGPWWSLRSDHAAYREVRVAAIADARRRAEDYAAAFGARLTGLVEISDVETPYFPSAGESRVFAMDAPDAAPAFDLQPGRQSVHGQVTARFTLSEVTLT